MLDLLHKIVGFLAKDLKKTAGGNDKAICSNLSRRHPQSHELKSFVSFNLLTDKSLCKDEF